MIQMILKDYLNRYNQQLEDILDRIDYTPEQIAEWQVIQYPDELLYELSKRLKQDISIILYELLHLENPGAIRRVSGDYGLLKAFETEATYIFIPQTYRKEQSSFLTDVLIDKKVYELELGPIAKYNFLGKKIYELFLSSTDKSVEYNRIKDTLDDYFVLVHDDSGTLLCHERFKIDEMS